jgi:predicted lipoprotein
MTDARQILAGGTGESETLKHQIATANLKFELATRVGTKQSIIARLEDTSYNGHTLTLLGCIATAPHQQLELTFVSQHESGRKP